MAILTRDQLQAALDGGQRRRTVKASLTGQTAGRPMSMFRVAGTPSSTAPPPSVAGSALSSATQGALPLVNNGGGAARNYIGQTSFWSTGSGVWTLCDRLVETAGLSGVVTTAQTVGSVALPARATGATDAELWLECYTTLGATATSATVAYTSQSGTAGRVATVIGGIPATWAAGQMIPCALQAGDTGVQSVQSVTLAASTLTAGSFGVTLLRVYTDQGLANNSGSVLGWAETGLPQLPNDACLAHMCVPNSATSPQVIGVTTIIQG